MITRASSLSDVAFEVCTSLERSGVTAVLTGGSAATVYAPDAHQSLDLDFVVQFVSEEADENALERLGYRLDGGHYVHKESELILEFPKGPLQVGGDLVETWNTKNKNDQILHLLSPTDCCRDRLAHFIFWNDRAGLVQAIAVARAEIDRVDFILIENWCEREGYSEKYLEFHKDASA